MRRFVQACNVSNAAVGAAFHTGKPSEKKLRRMLDGFWGYNGVNGRDKLNDAFHSRIKLINEEAPGDIYKDWTEDVAVVELVGHENKADIEHPSMLPPYSKSLSTKRSKDTVYELVRNGDAHYGTVEGYTILTAIDPVIMEQVFRYNEGLVELASCYRNILAEAESFPDHIRTVRIPALSMESHHYALGPSMPKMNQQGLDIGFQRMANRIRERIVHELELVVELYIPTIQMEVFERTFREPPYMIPMDNDPKPLMYPYYSLAPPPKAFLEYPEYIGKRKEIENAILEQRPIETAGTIGIDGKEIQDVDARQLVGLVENHDERIQSVLDEEEHARSQGFEPIEKNPSAAAAAPELPRFTKGEQTH